MRAQQHLTQPDYTTAEMAKLAGVSMTIIQRRCGELRQKYGSFGRMRAGFWLFTREEAQQVLAMGPGKRGPRPPADAKESYSVRDLAGIIGIPEWKVRDRAERLGHGTVRDGRLAFTYHEMKMMVRRERKR